MAERHGPNACRRKRRRTRHGRTRRTRADARSPRHGVRRRAGQRRRRRTPVRRLYVTAEFEHGEISGYIDHLLVTPDAYHVIDYKTGDVAPEEVTEDAAYYETQMQAYAVALNQQGTDRSVRVSLVFTAIDDAWETEWSPTDLDSMTARIDAEIWDRYEALDR